VSAEAELVYRMIDAYNRRDVEGMMDCCTEDVVWKPTITGGDTVRGGEFVGREGFARYWSEADQAWAEIRTELIGLESLEDGRLVGEGRLYAVGRASGAAVQTETWIAVRVRDGLLASIEVFQSREGAVQSLGTADA
jgi:ketosteroid isomerase-like protein